MKRLKGKITLLNTISSFILQIVLIINGFVIPKLILDAFGSDVNGLISSLTKFLQYIALVDGGITGVITAKLYKPLVDNDTIRISSILASAKKFYRRIGVVFIIYALILSVVYPLCFNTGFSFVYVMALALILMGVGVMASPAYADDPDESEASEEESSATGSWANGLNSAKGDNVPENLMVNVKGIVNGVLYIAGILAVVMVIIGGVKYTTSGGDQAAVTKAKNTILYGIVGLVISILAYAIVNFVLKQL